MTAISGVPYKEKDALVAFLLAVVGCKTGGIIPGD